MARSRKWLTDISPDDPVSIVARQALAIRLEAVSRLLPLAALHADEDPEHVHQLRISTRRATAALNLFAPLLPPRRADALRRRLKRLRRAAGQARDLDVQCVRLRQLAAQSGDARYESLMELFTAQRTAAQEPLRQENEHRQELRREMRGLLRRVRWRRSKREPRFRRYAPRALRPAIEAFFAAADKDLSQMAALHRMRNRGKQLRYSMELAAPAFRRGFRRQIYAVFTDVQERLGEMNDQAVAQQLYERLAEDPAAQPCAGQLRQMADDAGRQLEALADAFRAWWSPARRASLEKRFHRLMRKRVAK